MKICKLKRKNNCIDNKGMTLVEMIVSFALLSIFIMSAAVIIGSITTMYFEIKGENYSRQVMDIIMEKVESEIDGSKYNSGKTKENLRILSSTSTDVGATVDVGDTIVLSDKTDTKLKLYAKDGELVVHYSKIGDSYNETDWKFDKNVYNHFTIKKLSFVKGSNLAKFTDASTYGLTYTGTQATYGDDIICVFLWINSPRYGDYYTYRFVKMYNYSETP